ncbi:MAG TPA: efflux RND transporter permease subunit [Candidatus Obscuribacterales bacterium]
MGRPVTVMVAVLSIVLVSILAISRMKVDIFPDLNSPVICVVQPYGGMDPAQMEGYVVSEYEQHFLYCTGVEHIESKSIQSCSVMKIFFRPGTNMSGAMAEVMAQVERSKSYMPHGTVDPFVLRFDAGNVPVGFLVMTSDTRTVADVQELAYVRVRPVVSTIPGASIPPPFGGNQRSIVINLDPERLRAYHMSPEEVVNAINTGNTIIPSGIVRVGDKQRITAINSVVGNIQHLRDIPIREGAGPTVMLRDLGTVEDGQDIPTGYATVNGHRTVYIAIAKRSDASTLSVVNSVKASIPKIQDLLPDDVKVQFVFDQSIYVTEAMNGVLFEGGLGAILTGLVVLLFLKDVRSSLIVVLNIPFALLAAIVAMWMSGQTVNIMTLGGLSLSVGILVDEATVAIENIHTHLARGVPLWRGVYDACVEVVTPQLLAMLSVISVFLPSFFMTGSTQALFVPLSLAVGFSMVASYILSNTFVPVLSAWLLKPHAPSHGHNHGHEPSLDFVDRFKGVYLNGIRRFMNIRVMVLATYAIVAVICCVTIYPFLGREIFPAGNPTGFQLRLKAPTGTRIERTEDITNQAIGIIKKTVGAENMQVSVGYIGTQPPSYGISNVYMWTSGPQESVLLVALDPEKHINMAQLKERLRHEFNTQLPDVNFTFEAGDIVNKVLNFGAPTPIQIDINGPVFERDRAYADKLLAALKKLSDLRDVGMVQPLDYPTLDVHVDRERAGQLGVTVRDVGKALVAATYSSRFVEPIFWRDAKSGTSYQVELEVPQANMTSIADVENVPIKQNGASSVYLRDVAKASFDTMVGEYDRYNMQRELSLTANLATNDLGRAAAHVNQVIKSLGKPPKGVSVNVRGQVPSMVDTFSSLMGGLVFAVVVILLMLIAYFQSVKLSLVVVSIVPAIITGVLLMLLCTGTTLNVQSFMGAIMAIGVGVANAILVVVFQEEKRMQGERTDEAAIHGAVSRLRPVLMTSIAMIAGMIPMALGLGEGGDRTAPLGRAVIGGLAASTFSVLMILPLVYSLVQAKASKKSASMLPDSLPDVSDHVMAPDEVSGALEEVN